MRRCSDCGAEASAGADFCTQCGATLADGGVTTGRGVTGGAATGRGVNGGAATGKDFLTSLLAAGRHAIPFVGPSGVDTRVERRRIEDSKLEYALFLPFARSYLPIGIGLLGLFVGGASFFGLLYGLVGAGVVPDVEVGYGSVPPLWQPVEMVSLVRLSATVGPPGSGLAAALRVACVVGGLLPSVGYATRLARAAARGETAQPFFDDYLGTVVDGIRTYGLFALVVGGVELVGMGVEAGVSDPGAGVLGLLAAVALAYFLPAVLVLYAVSGRLSVALSPGLVADFATSRRYAEGVVEFLGSVLVILFVVFAVGFALGLTIVGLVLGVPLVFTLAVYPQYYAGAFWGATYYEIAADGGLPPAEAFAE